MCVLQRSFWLGTPCHLCKGTVKECKAVCFGSMCQPLTASAKYSAKMSLLAITIALYVKTSKK